MVKNIYLFYLIQTSLLYCLSNIFLLLLCFTHFLTYHNHQWKETSLWKSLISELEYWLLKTQILNIYLKPQFYFLGPHSPVASLKFLSQVYMWQCHCAMLIRLLLIKISAISAALRFTQFYAAYYKMRGKKQLNNGE